MCLVLTYFVVILILLHANPHWLDPIHDQYAIWSVSRSHRTSLFVHFLTSKEGMIKEWEPVMMEFKECGKIWEGDAKVRKALPNLRRNHSQYWWYWWETSGCLSCTLCWLFWPNRILEFTAGLGYHWYLYRRWHLYRRGCQMCHEVWAACVCTASRRPEI